MAFSREIKDFVGAFEKGWKLAEPSEYDKRRAEKREDDAAIDAEAARLSGQGSATAPHTYGSGDGSTTVSGIRTGSPTRFQAAASDPDSSGYINSVFTAESGHNPTAKNPNSSATGLGQFTTGTWAGLMRKYPDLGLTSDGRTNPEQTKRAMGVFTRDNAAVLKGAGFGTDDGNLYAAHRLGAPGAVRMLRGIQTDPNAPAANYMSPDAARANPTWVRRKDGSPKSAQEFYNETISHTRRRADAGDVVDTYEEPTQFAATGGRIMSPEETQEYTLPTAQQAQANPMLPQLQTPPSQAIRTDAPPTGEVARRATPDVGQTGSITDDSGPRTFHPKDFNVLDGIGEAVEAGLKGISRAFGLDRTQQNNIDTEYPQRVQRLHANEGAATPDEVRSIDAVVDPRRQLSEDARAVARMYAGYSYYAKKGEYRKAEDYSKSLLLYIRGHMQMAGAVAEDHLRNNDVKGAARAIAEAHNQIPDGSTLHIDKVGPDGKVDFRLVDDDGDLTERGSAGVNQLMQLAVGMKNGSEWYRQMTNLRTGTLSAAQKLAEKRRQRDEEALSTFNKDDAGDFRASMTDAQRAAFDKMSPQVQDKLKGDWNRQQSQDKAQARIDRQLDRDEKKDAYYRKKDERQEARDESARIKTEKDAKDSQEWSQHEDAIRDAQDAIAAQMAEDPEDDAKLKPLRDALTKATGDASNWMAGEPGRNKFSRALRDLNRAGRGGGAMGSAGGAGTGGTGKGGGTADERKAAQLEQQYISLQRKVKREGNTEEGQKQLAAMRADVEYAKRATDYDSDTEASIGRVLPGIFGVDDIAKLPEKRKTEMYNYQDAISDIMRGSNGITPEHAADIAKAAAATGKIERQADGRYSVNGSRPVYMSRDGIRALAAIYQANRPQQKPAATTTTRNPFEPDPSLSPAAQEDAREAAERQASREAGATSRQVRRKQAERQQLIEALGDDYRPSMTMSQMRKARMDRIARNRRNGVEGYEDKDINKP